MYNFTLMYFYIPFRKYVASPPESSVAGKWEDDAHLEGCE